MQHIHMYVEYSTHSHSHSHSVDEKYFDELSAEPINKFLTAGPVTIYSTVFSLFSKQTGVLTAKHRLSIENLEASA